MNSTNKHSPRIVAAIDLGSNSFHMIVARLEESGTLSVIDRLRENVRLGGGLDAEGNINDETQNRALNCLETFAQRIRDLPRTCVRIAGTNTLRVATNTQSFVKKSEAILNHPIEIIAGREEARLIYLGVAHGLATKDGNRIVVDIGGGSTELIIGNGMQSTCRESIYTGCVSTSKQYFNDGAITEDAMAAAELDAALKLLPQASDFQPQHWQEAIGCAGTIKAIAEIVREQGWCINGISYHSLLKLRSVLIDAKHINHVNLNGLSQNRKPVLAGGLSVLLAIFKTLKIEQMEVSEQGMREGLLYDLVGRISYQDVRDASVASAMSRWGIDIEQAERVTTTVETLYESTCAQWSIDMSQMKPLLRWASMLHEIGLQVSHNNYHKHGAYLLSHADMQGFSQQEQALLAALVLSHRSKFRINSFSELMNPFIETGTYMCILLRISVLLHRSRTNQPVPNIDMTVTNNEVSILFPKGWLDAHSMTLADLTKEINHLDNAGYKFSFK